MEPKFGHVKSDHRMDRCFLHGLADDAINAILDAPGANLRKLLNLLYFAMTEGRIVLFGRSRMQLAWLCRPTWQDNCPRATVR